jgi:hypothetical protein
MPDSSSASRVDAAPFHPSMDGGNQPPGWVAPALAKAYQVYQAETAGSSAMPAADVSEAAIATKLESGTLTPSPLVREILVWYAQTSGSGPGGEAFPMPMRPPFQIDGATMYRANMDPNRGSGNAIDGLALLSSQGSTSTSSAAKSFSAGLEARALRGEENEAAAVVTNFDGSASGRDPLESSRIRFLHGSLEALLTTTVVVTSTPGSSNEPAVESSETSAQSAIDEDSIADEDSSLFFRGKELLAAFTPFDRASVERAIDHLIEGLSALEVGLPSLEEATNFVPHALGVAAALVAVEVIRSRRAGKEEDGEDGSSPGLPGFPVHWELDER